MTEVQKLKLGSHELNHQGSRDRSALLSFVITAALGSKASNAENLCTIQHFGGRREVEMCGI